MKTLATPETEPDLFLPRWATCLKHGRRFLHSDDYDARAECPDCRRSRQNLCHYGLSNALDAPDRGATGNGQRATGLVVGFVIAVALLAAAFAWALHNESRRLDAAVARMERASR